jgi:magnesium-transporting ATPase (P-type)
MTEEQAVELLAQLEQLQTATNTQVEQLQVVMVSLMLLACLMMFLVGFLLTRGKR